jgi:hypothetical protein
MLNRVFNTTSYKKISYKKDIFIKNKRLFNVSIVENRNKQLYNKIVKRKNHSYNILPSPNKNPNNDDNPHQNAIIVFAFGMYFYVGTLE